MSIAASIALVLMTAPGPSRTTAADGDEGTGRESCESGGVAHGGTAALAAEEHARGVYVEQLSWTPRAYTLHRILTREECDHLISIAGPRLAPSAVHDKEVRGGTGASALVRTPPPSMLTTAIHPQSRAPPRVKTGKLRESENRTSLTAWVRRGEDDIVKGIVERVSRYVGAPAEHVRYLQVLHYSGPDHFYRVHLDTLGADSRAGRAVQGRSGHRFATALLYLSDVDEGGETAFPHGEWIDGRDTRGQTFSDCMGHSDGVLVKPKRGSALLFYSLDNAGEIDWTSMHAGCPVVSGTKWVATLWYHQLPADEEDEEDDSDSELEDGASASAATGRGCRDASAMCATWAMAGECDANPTYMIGNWWNEGKCKLSCGACR